MGITKTETVYRGFTIISTRSPVTKRARHHVYSPRKVHLKTFDHLVTACRHIDAIVTMQEKRK
jgi:hypothetical protein